MAKMFDSCDQFENLVVGNPICRTILPSGWQTCRASGERRTG